MLTALPFMQYVLCMQYYSIAVTCKNSLAGDVGVFVFGVFVIGGCRVVCSSRVTTLRLEHRACFVVES